MDFYLDIEKGVGTYLKVVRSHGPDSLIVLYLRPEELFLMVGYWEGYENSAAAGRWSRSDSKFNLEGQGYVHSDSEHKDKLRFSQVFNLDDQNFTPMLTAPAEAKGWSLLSWTGPFTYVGYETVIDPDGRWLPDSISKVDSWIEKMIDE